MDSVDGQNATEVSAIVSWQKGEELERNSAVMSSVMELIVEVEENSCRVA